MRIFNNKLPLIAQLVITSVITVLVVVSLMFYQTIQLQNKIYEQELETKAYSLRNNVSATKLFLDLRKYGHGNENIIPQNIIDELNIYMEKIYQYDEDLQYFAIYNKSGKVIYVYAPSYYFADSNNKINVPKGRNADIPVLGEVLTQLKLNSLLFKPFKNNDLTSFLFPLAGYGAEADYYIEFGFSQLRAEDIKNKTTISMFVITIIVLLIGVFLATWRAVVLIRPIQKLTKLTEEFGKGDLSVRAFVKGSHETINLARNFNSMAKQIQVYISKLKMLYDVSRKLTSLSNKELTLKKMAFYIKADFNLNACCIYICSEDEIKQEVSFGIYEPVFLDEKIKECIDSSSSIQHIFSGYSVLYVPFNTDNKKLGVIAIARENEKFSSFEIMLMETLSNQAAVGYSNSILYEQTITDSLTKLYLRRFLEIKTKEQIDAYGTTELNTALLMIDIDNFKSINDTYGHTAGDEILRIIAGILMDSTRQYDFKCATRPPDVPARYGGEEFSVLLPEISHKNALMVAERIRKNIEESNIVISENKIKVTVSIGMAFIIKNDSFVSIVERADKYLYEAKHTGKNRVCYEK